jgi:uncharacterized protein (TIGR02217 family)
MAFHDVRFPECIEIGATGGPRFKTTALILGSGYEKRNIEWSRVRGSWDIGSGIKTAADMEAVIAFFYARQGRAHGFRFKDWTDYQIGTPDAPLVVGTGTGSATAFQLVKRYVSGGYYFARAILAPVSGTVVASTNESPTRSYSVDYSTGIITFTTPPANGATVYAHGEFDVPVRFDQDELDIVGVFDGVQNIPSIRIVELRSRA